MATSVQASRPAADSSHKSESTHKSDQDYARDSARSTQEHQAYTNLLGYLIHPAIPITSPTIKIADIGTGTGIWLTEVAKSLPQTCTLSGFDISTSQFPSAECTPPNVTFYEQDLRHTFSQRHIGFYDIVAVRSMSLVLVGDEWATALKNLTTLLKPGGYIQWIDSDFSDSSFACVSSGNPSYMRQAREAFSIWMAKNERDCKDASKLIDTFKHNGELEAIEGQLVPTDRTSKSAEECSKIVIGVVMMGLEKGLDMKREDLDEMKRGMLREGIGGRNHFRYDIHVALGRKKAPRSGIGLSELSEISYLMEKVGVT